MRIIHDPACLEYQWAGHPERPERVERTVERLRQCEDLRLTWTEPTVADAEAIRRVHDERHLARLSDARDFDADTPWHEGIDDRARFAVAGALDALRSAQDGEPAMSLLRPPGHHALSDRAMGFCYLNQVAAAALEARTSERRVAVFDFDVHHGNGTEAILAGKSDVSFHSIHSYPAYPGTGGESHGNAHNYPMRPGVARPDYVGTLKKAFDEMMAASPDVLLISAGFDAFRGDPLSTAPLEPDDYRMLGELVAGCGVPAAAVLEGGYSDELPDLVLAFLQGWAAADRNSAR